MDAVDEALGLCFSHGLMQTDKLPPPGFHWYLCRQLPKKLNKFVDLANSLQLPNDVMTNVAGPNVPVSGCLGNFQGS